MRIPSRNPITGLDPAVNTGSGTEYFVDSTSFLGTKDVPAPSANTLDLSALANTAAVTTGPRHAARPDAKSTRPTAQFGIRVPRERAGAPVIRRERRLRTAPPGASLAAAIGRHR